MTRTHVIFEKPTRMVTGIRRYVFLINICIQVFILNLSSTQIKICKTKGLI